MNPISFKMKHLSKFAALFLLMVTLASCTKDQCKINRTYTKYTPVFISYEDFRTSSVYSDAPQAIKQPGKIYFKDNLIFINEYLKGVHVIDNSSPSNPVNIGFIHIPGNVDIAVKCNTLYADSYIDLVAIDITSPSQAHELGRVQDIFPYQEWQYGQYVDPANGIVKEWLAEETTETYMGDCDGYWPSNGGGVPLFDNGGGVSSAFGGGVANDQSSASSGSEKGAYPGIGIGGSMAKVTLYQDKLYAIINEGVQVFDVATCMAPTLGNQVFVGSGIETLFPYEDNLFVGSTNGMYVLDITDPALPTEDGFIGHWSSCDPVVVNENTAYVTLRNGTRCWGYTNQLEIIDVTNTTSPQLIKTYPMFNPHGLGIDNKTLFLCDGSAGLKVFDVTDPNNIDMTDEYSNINTFDVIPLAHLQVLVLIGSDGMYQYDYSDPGNIKLLSTIPVEVQ